MSSLKVGDRAPAFTLPATNEKNISLKDFKNKKLVVLYFYPKDDTPGCTLEACGFRDEMKSFQKENAVILGVSPDSVARHEKFITKFKLPFHLLSDEKKNTCQDYGVWVEKNMYGRKYMGVARTTFLISKAGKIIHIFEKVKPQEHDKEVIAHLQLL